MWRYFICQCDFIDTTQTATADQSCLFFLQLQKRAEAAGWSSPNRTGAGMSSQTGYHKCRF